MGQAAGVVLLVPLLDSVGVRASSGISRWTVGGFRAVGLRPTLGTVLCVYVAVTAATAALGAYQSVLSTRFRLEFVDHLRARLYGAVGRAEWRHLMGLRQSDVLAVLTTNVAWVGVGVLGALQIVVAAIVVSAQLVAATRISAPMTVLAVASGAALIAGVWPLVRRSRRLGAELVERTRGVVGLATGFLDALKLAKAYGREQEHLDEFERAVAGSRRSQVEFARATGIANAAQLALTALLLAVTVDVAVRDLHVPVGSLLVIAFVFTRVVSQLTSSQTSIQQIAQALPAFDEVMGLIASCENAQEASADAPVKPARIGIGGGIRLDDVHFSYPPRGGDPVEALSGVSLELSAGSMVALVGPSGAGKTTVADLIAGLILPSAGEIRIDGQPLTADRVLGWRSSVALVPQDPFLFHDTIGANLRWARPGATGDEMWHALTLAGAADFVEQLPRRLESVVGDRGMRLSGGERQRLALARALLRDPDLLILDEATSSLDTESERVIRTALAALRGQTTILVIAHRLSTVSEADQIVVLDAGRVVEAGSWSELSHVPAGRLQALIEAGASGPMPLSRRGPGSTPGAVASRSHTRAVDRES
ncbi:MAG: ATP-binding cassette, subfamily bacterial [Solirubrobacteraceae bacterium]|nr:ATP-binding cassette, subfamily bacterial [Solirubrobacteraceae bacterium]